MATSFTPVSALIGGGLIGLSATWLMLSVGRIAGISGVLGHVLRGQAGWQLWFLGGLVLGAGLWLWGTPLAFVPRTGFPPPVLIAAGLLVGIGTRMGSGCTSGHGVCGLARLSSRSIAATLTFLTAGVVTVFVVRHQLGGF
ncbi:MAG TPA: YeeE/YedE family protein [Pseudomonadales bacterium]|nr:YeeE/YedE family protein [Pseudomonadales bacterium]